MEYIAYGSNMVQEQMAFRCPGRGCPWQFGRSMRPMSEPSTGTKGYPPTASSARLRYERIVQLPCTNVIPPEQQDKRLLEKLLSEREDIVYRMVMALKTVIANGYRLTEPDSIKAARRRYQEENTTVITVFEDCMKPLTPDDKHHLCSAMKVYTAYQGWCRDNNRGYFVDATVIIGLKQNPTYGRRFSSIFLLYRAFCGAKFMMPL